MSPDRLWLELVLLFIGGAALDDLSDYMNGIYYARKKTSAVQVSVWISTTDSVIVRRVGDVLRSTFQTHMQCSIDMEFASHGKPAKKKPFRNPGHMMHSSRGVSFL